MFDFSKKIQERFIAAHTEAEEVVAQIEKRWKKILFVRDKKRKENNKLQVAVVLPSTQRELLGQDAEGLYIPKQRQQVTGEVGNMTMAVVYAGPRRWASRVPLSA